MMAFSRTSTSGLSPRLILSYPRASSEPAPVVEHRRGRHNVAIRARTRWWSVRRWRTANMASAERIAAFLEADDRIAHVAYPGLASHPQHDLACRQLGGAGFGGMMAFATDADRRTRNRFVGDLLFAQAASKQHCHL